MTSARTRHWSAGAIRVRGALPLACLLLALGAACHRPTGRLQYTTLRSRAEGRPLRYGVYVPPSWDRQRPLPLVLLLHGAGDDHTAADRAALIDNLERAVRSGALPPFVLVTPEGERGFWLNWHDASHHYRDWVMDEVLPAVRARYPLLSEPEGLHLLGVSMGGGGGLQLWLKERVRFASATILSAPILNEHDTRAFLRGFVSSQALDQVFGPEGRGSGVDPYAALQSEADLQHSKLVFGAASHDRGGILASNRAFHGALAARGVPHHLLVFDGKHRWSTWQDVFPYALCLQLAAPCTLAPPAGIEDLKE
ncbi:MAG TPA: alpha/beta hydrolase-fold protein [Polyangiales bacterium]